MSLNKGRVLVKEDIPWKEEQPTQKNINKEIIDILSSNWDKGYNVYEVFQRIKGEKGLKSSFLIFPHKDMVKLPLEQRNEIKEYYEKLKMDEVYNEYRGIKDNPHLKAHDLKPLYESLNGFSPKAKEIEDHYIRLKTNENKNKN